MKTPGHGRKYVGIVEEDEEDQVDETRRDGDQDDGVDVEDDPTDGDDMGRSKILLEEEAGHVDHKVERVETHHVVPDRWAGITNWSGDAEDVDVGHVDPPKHILHHLMSSCWRLSNLASGLPTVLAVCVGVLLQLLLV